MATRRVTPTQDEIDAAYMREWVEWGFRELEVFLAHHADFERWCACHQRQEGEP